MDAPRRHADGSLDIDHYRRRARRLRRIARRRAWAVVAAACGAAWAGAVGRVSASAVRVPAARTGA